MIVCNNVSVKDLTVTSICSHVINSKIKFLTHPSTVVSVTAYSHYIVASKTMQRDDYAQYIMYIYTET